MSSPGFGNYTREELRKIASLNDLSGSDYSTPGGDDFDFDSGTDPRKRKRLSRSEFRRQKSEYEKKLAKYNRDLSDFNKAKQDRKNQKQKPKRETQASRRNKSKASRFGMNFNRDEEGQDKSSKRVGKYDPVAQAMKKGYYEYDDKFSAEANKKAEKEFRNQAKQDRFKKLDAIDPEKVFANIREDFGPDAENYARRQAAAREGESISRGMYTRKVDTSKGYNPAGGGRDMERMYRDRNNNQIAEFQKANQGIDMEGSKYYIPWWKQSGVVNRKTRLNERQQRFMQGKTSGPSGLPVKGRRGRF